MLEANVRYQEARRITLLGAMINFGLAIIKITCGKLGSSHALVADGIHSFSDLLTDGLILLASHYGSQEADSEHPYGHRRIETVATVAVSLLLILAGIGIFIDASDQFFTHTPATPSPYILLVAGLSIAFKEGLFHYTRHIAKRIGSNLLHVNAWHHRSDAAASIVVLIGVIGTLLGFKLLDAIAAVMIGFMIVKMGLQQGWTSLRELVDTGMDDDKTEAIKTMIISVPGVQALHQLRTRSMGDRYLLDVHILVNPFLTVSEGHFIGQKVQAALTQEFAEISDITVHVDPEDDEINPPSDNLPARQEIVPLLHQRWQNLPGIQQITYIALHYLAGKLRIEIYLPSVLLTQHTTHELLEQYKNAIMDLTFIADIKIWYG